MTRIAHVASLALFGAVLTSAPPATAQTYSVLWNFKDLQLGTPLGRIFIHGSLFGTGSGVNSTGYGQVFELTKSNGVWNSTSILKFNSTDGANPNAALLQDASGSLYGTTQAGDVYGYGNVFKLTKSGNSWVHSTVWAFGGTGDGQSPTCDLVMDGAGDLYGTTHTGGPYGQGNAFELIYVNGGWTETILHNFGSGSDGAVPWDGLVLDNSGALYGTTWHGGTHTDGTVFKLTQSGGVWTEDVLYNFAGGSDGEYPYGILIEDSAGNLYGTTTEGGPDDAGTVFELSQSGGVWTEQVLYSFTGGSDGGVPFAGLHWGGNFSTLYGAAHYGGDTNGDGTVFKLSKSGGKWSETTVHTFGSIPNDGTNPTGQIVRDNHGNLYGTTVGGGTHEYFGTVWELTP